LEVTEWNWNWNSAILIKYTDNPDKEFTFAFNKITSNCTIQNATVDWASTTNCLDKSTWLPKYVKIDNLNTCRNNILQANSKQNCNVKYEISKKNSIILYLPKAFKEDFIKNNDWNVLWTPA